MCLTSQEKPKQHSEQSKQQVMVAEEADLVQAEFQTARTTWGKTKNSEALPYYKVTRIYSALFVWVLLVVGLFPFLRQS